MTASAEHCSALLAALVHDAARARASIGATPVSPAMFRGDLSAVLNVAWAMPTEALDLRGLSAKLHEGGRPDLADRLADEIITRGTTSPESAGHHARELVRLHAGELRRDAGERLAKNPSDGRARDLLAEAGGLETRIEGQAFGPLVRFDDHGRAPFPVEVLPELFGAFVRETAEAVQVPPDLPGVLALGAVALAGAKLYEVAIGQTHAEPLNLYLLCLMDPGSRKSAAFSAAFRPVADFEAMLADATKPERARLAERHAIEEARLAELRRRIAKEPEQAERMRLQSEAESLAANRTQTIAAPRLLSMDISPEAAARMLGEQGGRLGICDPEGGCFFEIVQGRYSKDGAPNMEVFLRAHSGEDDLRVDRATREGEVVRRPALTMVLTGQPAILRELKHRAAMEGRGLLARFLYSIPASNVGKRMYRNRPADAGAVRAYAEALGDLLDQWKPGRDSAAPALPLRIEGEALEIWTRYADETERAQAPGGELSGMTFFASKLAGAAARLAGVLHLMRHGPRAASMAIAPDAVAGGWALAEYFKTHAIAAFGAMAERREVTIARAVLDWMRRNRLAEGTVADAYRALRRNHGIDTSADTLAAVLCLAEMEAVRVVDPDRPDGQPGRPASVRFIVNPEVHRG